MRVTSLKDVEAYIYSSVVLPLKGLDVQALYFPSPISSKNGHTWQFNVRFCSVDISSTRDNYRRTMHNRDNYLVSLEAGLNQTPVVVDYDPKTRLVLMYERPFRELGAMPLFSKLYDAFRTNTPFIKIKVDKESLEYDIAGSDAVYGCNLTEVPF